jgi:hypothetical protein
MATFSSGLAPVLSFIYKVKTMLKTQSRSLNPVKAAILISAVVLPFLHSQAAHANYMDTYFKDGMTIRLVTPVGLNVNLPYATNGGMINTFISDNTNDWKFKVIRSSADGIKFQRIGTNHLITAKKFPSANLSPLEAWQNVGGEDKFQTWVAIPTQPGFFALCLKAQRDQCMNVPNSKDKTKLTTYNFNPNDRDQMFSVGILSNTSDDSTPLSLKRAKAWVDKEIAYDQGRYYDGYRQDCSGFVSMAWQLGTSAVTGTLPQYSRTLGSKDDLQPGDAINNRQAGNSGHVVLFVRWIDKAQGKFVAYEENGGWGKAVQTNLTLSIKNGGWDIPEYRNHNPWFLERKK